MVQLRGLVRCTYCGSFGFEFRKNLVLLSNHAFLHLYCEENLAKLIHYEYVCLAESINMITKG
jgi:hypothetical protein